MYLINTKTLQLQFFLHEAGHAASRSVGTKAAASSLPRYAILSHTWGANEVLFEDMMAKDRNAAKKKSGYSKIEYGCRRAAADGFDYLWLDTCCVDKNSLADLSETINSMFRWYKTCSLCYVFLEDCQGPKPYQVSPRSNALPKWFTRGWTLQELIAPNTIHFYSAKWAFLGTKADHIDGLSNVTGIDQYALGGGDLSKISVARRMSWMANRRTTRTEDMVYCLLGIFGITMPLLYGEGSKAFARLQKEIMKETDDQSIFAWKEEDGTAYRNSGERNGLLAYSPLSFASSTPVTKYYSPRPGARRTAVTSQGSVANLLLCQDTSSRSNDIFFAILDCPIGHMPGVLAGIRLKRKDAAGNDFIRVDTSQVFEFARCEKDGSLALEGFDPTKEQRELVEIKTRAVCRNWVPRTIRVLQSSVPQLPPGFWLVPPQNMSSSNEVSLQMVHPMKLWDSQNWLMQPSSAASLTPKTGAAQFKYKGKQYFLIFGAATAREGLRPWCAIEQSSGRVALEQWFTQFKADMDKPNGGARRSPEIDVKIRPAKVSGNDMFVMQLLTR
ncbi:heterokaryon incompatibility domain-containing protein [Trichoderma sp. SZMC 28015]